MGEDTIDRLLDRAYLAGVAGLRIEEIRAKRAELQEAETGLSYLRRVVQGRIDIASAELRRRREGGDPADVSRLIEQLPTILADHLRAPGVGRLPLGVGSGTVDPAFQARVDEAVAVLDDLAVLSDDELDAAGTRLADLEHETSDRRHALFERIDALQAELTRRYRAGEANVESLLK